MCSPKLLLLVFLFAKQTTTTSLFQVKYNLQSLCPQLARATRGGHKRKKENSVVNIDVYIKRAILEEIYFVKWFIARVRQEGRL